MTKQKQREILDKYSVIKSVEDCDTWIDETTNTIIADLQLNKNTMYMYRKRLLMCNSVNEMNDIATDLYNWVQKQ